MSKTEPSNVLAVFDFGKTNAKMLVFAPNGEVIGSARSNPKWRDIGDTRVLDDDALWTWMQHSLKQAVQDYNVERVMISTHGCTYALIKDDHLALPILDYECPVPAHVQDAFEKVRPDYYETFSPKLPNGLNHAIQILWREMAEPGVFAGATGILSYPQFWSWKLSGVPVNEVSFLGAHSCLWAPGRDDFSSLVDVQGWRSKMPKFARAGSAIGTYELTLDNGEKRELTIHNGVHDSNASLYFYRALGLKSFTLISTGTWVIVFNTDAPLSVLDEPRDMLANVTIDHQPVVTSRFMGGREFDVITDAARVAITLHDIETAIAKGQMALPSFAPSGPFPDQVGHLIGPPPTNEVERAAIGSLYLACMSVTSLNLVHSNNPVIIDGGLANNSVYPSLIASLWGKHPVMVNAKAEGTAAGAAAMAYETFMQSPFSNPCVSVESEKIQGLADYFATWTELVNRSSDK